MDLNFEFDDSSLAAKLCGVKDSNIKEIEKSLGVSIVPRGNVLMISGDDTGVENANSLMHLMSDYLHDKDDSFEFDPFDLRYLIDMSRQGIKIRPEDISRLKVKIPDTGKTVYPKSYTQAHYLSEISKKSIVFGVGPAGTGKTYLAVAAALREYYAQKVSRIILTRPAVEAGESLGYLPGDFMQKINPYLRPLYDALFDLMSYEKVTRLIENNTIEIAPLAYMRGRTLNNAFIILDESQNTTKSQMKMFLTRLGNNSKMVISGDATQIDIDKPSQSGLLHSMKILRGIKEISFVEFGPEDICRHPVVQKIVSAYDAEAGENK
ncbi:MAG TPA: PhoH family protein [Spirochaetota bacterium]|jgi:phosphate starvation-inducible PhoH-like protein|nr:PhoH family protein [Spirochaetota bacterium]HOH37027.1 PhoH family protein [Spirochaetota bacterium]HPY02688.1 PhoH family protein [Spirochaetota bacterium]HQA51305.1 PhoH family protein [Spirochaetota bacterium]